MHLRLLFAATLLAASVLSAAAASLIVNSLAPGAPDALAGDGLCEATPGGADCSLVGAIQEANALAGGDSIALPAGTFPAWPVNEVRDAVVISGAGPSETTILGDGGDTVLAFDSVDVTLVGVTVTGGHGGNVGGGITNYSGHLTVIDSVIRDNTAVNVGGGIYNQGGRLTLIGTTVVNNFAMNVGGGIYNQGTADLVNSTITGNGVWNTGGGIHNEGAMSISSCTVTNNYCTNTGAGIDNRSDGHGPVVLRNSLVAWNWLRDLLTGQPVGGYVDCIGDLESRGYNLIKDPFLGDRTGTGAATDLIGQLAPPALRVVHKTHETHESCAS